MHNSTKALLMSLLVMCIILIADIQVFAQCGPFYTFNTADIPWVDTGGPENPVSCTLGGGNATFSGITDIVAAFNNARTVENGQLTTTLPLMTAADLGGSDAAWNANSPAQKALILMNLERTARGIPQFQSPIDPNVQTVAQSYADYLLANDKFAHDLNCIPDPGPGNCNPTYRMEQNANIAGHQQFACRSENIATSAWPDGCASALPLQVERSVYGWIYQDLGSGNGHREACFYNGFTDDYGTPGTEGLVGVGVATGHVPRTIGGTTYANGTIVVFDFFDPNNVYTVPVELLSFTSVVADDAVHLDWQTATEVNNYGFEIQRASSLPDSKAGSTNTVQSWEKIGFVAGHGNSNSPKEYSFFDFPKGGTIFQYRLKQLDTDGKFEFSDVVQVDLGLPKNYTLEQNYPNPFNPTTSINFSIPTDGLVKLSVYDVLGNEVAQIENGYKAAGNYSNTFDASKLTSGVYFYTIKTANFRATKKMILLQ